MLSRFVNVLILLLAVALPAAAVDFGREVRPILSDRCFACHGPDAANRKTPLRLDSEAGLNVDLATGGRAIVPGKPEESALIARITSDDPILRMPPSYAGRDKLSDKEIGVLRQWVQEGAPWEEHWSFTPPAKAALPEVSDPSWVNNPVDRYVLAQLDQQGLKPSPAADRPTMIRRLSLDLTGLPPTPAEVDAFVADRSERAYENLVDRLLASPRFGEHMGRRWLDAARYADTNGYQSDGVRDMWRWRDWVIGAFNSNKPFDEFTIEQIAGDLLPSATRDQIIATAFHRNHRSNAEGGIVEEEFRSEYVSDRAETTATVWLGLAAGCARCHDHKYDPISQKEYYQLYAYFNNTPDRGLVYNYGNEEPFIQAPTPENETQLAELEREIEKSEKHWKAVQPKLRQAQAEWEPSFREPGDWSIAEGRTLHFDFDGKEELQARACGRDEKASCAPTYVEGKRGRAIELKDGSYLDLESVARFDYMDPFTFSIWIKPAVGTGAILSREEDAPEGMGYGIYLREGRIWMHITRRWTDISLRLRTAETVALDRWQHLAVSYDGKRKGKGVQIYLDGEELTKEILFDELTYPFPADEPFKIGAGGGVENRYSGLVDELAVWDRALTPEEISTLPVLESPAEITAIPADKRTPGQQVKLTRYFLAAHAPAELRLARLDWLDARRARDEYDASIPTVMVMQELPEPRQAHVLVRGAYDAPGEEVQPGVPAALPPLKPEWKNNRLGLARWLVDQRNPLTARVTVNRFWQGLFGAGIVRTAEDFGSQGEPPTNQELLDWLAVDFMDNGWNVKATLKTIVMSATYRQSSKASKELIEKDPENRLYARGPRFRMAAELSRDQALFASGLLVEQLGGPSVKPYQPPGLWEELSGSEYVPDTGEDLYRRSMYTYWKRTVAPPSMVNMDAPDRERCIVRRARTNTPLQALGLMNDVTFVEASRKMAERMLREGGETVAGRIERGFRLATARKPTERESAVLMKALQTFQQRFEGDENAAWAYLAEGDSPWDRELNAEELAAYSNLASLILNLDETVTKE